MEERAYAKINLALHVRSREPDGYHRIETLFAFAEEGDRLEVRDGEGLTLELAGPFADRLGPADDNLVMAAARRLRPTDGRGAALRLDKRLPVASGIGGGSADAAAALRLLSRWWGLADAPLEGIARGLGADVPACLYSRTARGEGRGDRLEPVDEPDLAGTPLLLVNPAVPLSTASVFAAWDGCDRGPLGDNWREGRNDLEAPARRLAPAIGEALDLLQAQRGAEMVRMSGSGATCFALFADEQARDAAASALAAARPGWWRLATRLR